MKDLKMTDKEHKIETKLVYSLFDDEGNLIDQDKRKPITSACTFWPEDLAVGSVTVSRNQPMMVYAFGGNASLFVSSTVPYPIAPGEREKAELHATKTCESHIVDQMTQYKGFLDNIGIDWQKVESEMKKRK